jgi:hypothetical protein
MTDVLTGLQIKLARTNDVPCAECGETAVAIGSNAGIAGLRCICCDRHRGWLPKAIADFLVAAIDHFGRPTVPISVHNSKLAAPLGAVAVETSTAPWRATAHDYRH